MNLKKRICTPICCLLISSSTFVQSNANAQEYKPRKITSKYSSRNNTNIITNMDFDGDPITDIFQVISNTTGWTIMLSKDLAERPPKIAVWLKNMPADDALDEVATHSRTFDYEKRHNCSCHELSRICSNLWC